MEELLQGQLELVRLKQSKIWVDVWESLWLLPIAQESTSIETWLRFTKVFASQDFGDASMNSIESLLQHFLSLQPKLKLLQLQRNKDSLDSSSQKRKSLSNLF